MKAKVSLEEEGTVRVEEWETVWKIGRLVWKKGSVERTVVC
jgi:hypothetical protein